MQKCSPGLLTLRQEKRRLTPTGDGAWWARKIPPLDVKPIAEEIYELVAAKNPHEWLKWNGSAEVKILVGKVLPSAHIPQQTLQARRKRLRLEVDKTLVEHGWEKIGLYHFKQRGRPCE